MARDQGAQPGASAIHDPPKQLLARKLGIGSGHGIAAQQKTARPRSANEPVQKKSPVAKGEHNLAGANVVDRALRNLHDLARPKTWAACFRRAPAGATARSRANYPPLTKNAQPPSFRVHTLGVLSKVRKSFATSCRSQTCRQSCRTLERAFRKPSHRRNAGSDRASFLPFAFWAMCVCFSRGVWSSIIIKSGPLNFGSFPQFLERVSAVYYTIFLMPISQLDRNPQLANILIK